MKYRIFTITAVIVSALGIIPAARAQNQQAYDPEKTYQMPADAKVQDRLQQWQELKFGLFMHWGIYSEWGIVESWSLCPEDRSFCQRTGPFAADWAAYKRAYENLQTTFNPVHFNPDKWAAAASNAGMKYIVFTTKHHDGFCMYDTKYTDYKVTGKLTPFAADPKADVTRSVFEAFRKKDFMIGAYFSKPDWHSQDYWWSYFPPKDRNESYDRKIYPERWKRFTDFTYNQVEELSTRYGKLDVLWFDGSWADMDMSGIVDMARRGQPGIIIVDRHGKPEYVNYLTPEQKIPDHYIASPWETCMTMGKSWSYIKDEEYKPARQLIQILVDIVAKNGNLLLDIGPGPDGEWHREAYDRLTEIGKWIAVNGESVYGTKPFAPYRQGQWAFTAKGTTHYQSYLPKEQEKELPQKLWMPLPLMDKHATVTLLGYSKPIKRKVSEQGFLLEIPAAAIRSSAGQPVWVFKISHRGAKSGTK